MKVFIPYDAALFKRFMGKNKLHEGELDFIHDAVWSKLFHPAICDYTFKGVKLCRPGFEEEMKENDRLISILAAQEGTISFKVDGTRCETQFTREQFEKHVFDQAHEHWVGVISNGKQYKKDPDPLKEEKNRKEAEKYAKDYSERGIAIVSELRKRVQYTEEMRYLDESLKKEYMDDFDNNVLTLECESWKLDHGLDVILTNINANPNIQTIYSKKFNVVDVERDAERFGFYRMNHESYLQFAYSKEVEPYIMDVFTVILKDKYPNVDIAFSEGRKNGNYDPSNTKLWPELKKLKCMSDERYFDIAHVDVSIDEYNYEVHDSLWKDMEELLMKAKP